MNTQKYEIYKSIHESLSKALRYGSYYEAIFLEYAVVKDCLVSVLKYAGIPYIDKNGQDVSISKKLNLIESRKELSDKFYWNRLTKELIQECRDWIKERNDLIHHMAYHMRAELCCETLKNASLRYPGIRGAIVHSD